MNRLSFPHSRGTPISVNASGATVNLYRRLLDQGKRSSFLFGTSDMLRGAVADFPAPQFYGTLGDFFGVSGRRAAIFSAEYHDSAWTARYGSTGTDYVRAQIIAAANAGMVIALHHHPGNPVTGALAGAGTAWPPAGTGSSYDLTGSPVTACLAGGVQDAQFLAYLDRLTDFLNSLVDAQGRKIPVIFRWLHEVNGGWFWWSEGSAAFVSLWRRMVTYLKDTKGVTNALYCVNWTTENSVLASWYPGDAYVDVVSLDHYNNDASPTFSYGGKWASAWAAMQAVNASKPALLAELGYQQHTTRPSVWLESVTAIAQQKRIAGVMLWRPSWGPSVSDSAPAKAGFQAGVAEPRVLTLPG